MIKEFTLTQVKRALNLIQKDLNPGTVSQEMWEYIRKLALEGAEVEDEYRENEKVKKKAEEKKELKPNYVSPHSDDTEQPQRNFSVSNRTALKIYNTKFYSSDHPDDDDYQEYRDIDSGRFKFAREIEGKIRTNKVDPYSAMFSRENDFWIVSDKGYVYYGVMFEEGESLDDLQVHSYVYFKLVKDDITKS